MAALATKTVILVTHQVEFLSEVDRIVVRILSFRSERFNSFLGFRFGNSMLCVEGHARWADYAVGDVSGTIDD